MLAQTTRGSSTNRARVASLRRAASSACRAASRAHAQEWVRDLKSAGVPCGSVREVAEVLADPQLDARGMIETVEHVSAGAIRVLGVPIKLSDTPGAVRLAPPALGQHTDRILQDDCGLSAGEIDRLRARKVV